MTKKTLIYIIGAGRSGTTLLDILLGNNNNSVSLGEINRFFIRGGVPPKREQNSEVYCFWSKVRNAFIDIDFNQIARTFKRNEYHSFIMKSLFKKNDKEYIRIIKKKYDLLKQISQEKVLIESSKYPARALNLSSYLSNNEISVKYIYLKKDPVKVVNSFQKKDLEQPSKNFILANFYYFIVNLLCMITVFFLKKRNHKVSVVKYEELITSCIKTIEKMENDLEEDFSDVKTKIHKNTPLTTGFLFDGNRIRLKEKLFLKPLLEDQKKNFNYYFTRIFNFPIYKQF